MAFPVTKVLIGVGTAGVLGGSSYGIYSLTKDNDSVENYLKKQSLTVVSQQSKAEWDKAYETYQLEKNLINLEITVSSRDDIKKWCSDNLSKTINSTKDPLYKKASKWCVKYKTIKEQIGDKAFEEIASKLDSKYAGLDQNIKKLIDAIQVTQNQHVNGEKIKKWCTDNAKRTYSTEDTIYSANIDKICLTNPG